MSESTMKTMQASSYLSGGNAAYVEELYETFLKSPDSLDQQWRDYFNSLPVVSDISTEDVSHAAIREYFLKLSRTHAVASAPVTGDVMHMIKQNSVNKLIDAYRRNGHMAAELDPLGQPRPAVKQLAMTNFELSDADYDTQFEATDLMGSPTSSLRDIITCLEHTYCNTIGVEYMYMHNADEVKWIQQRLEAGHGDRHLSAETQQRILHKLTAAEGMEQYLGTRYVGQKRFSLEGNESLIVLIDELIQRAGTLNTKEIIIGMAHRGRLNVLLNIMGQAPNELFQEFEGTKDYGLTSGDVKYHLGFSSDVTTPGGPVHLSLSFNPSHLEVINSVVTGSVRARQHRRGDNRHTEVMPILCHGDSAFAGQGIVMEIMNMSQTRGYGVGGSVHIVVNNQVGFTTSDPEDTRSSMYCTDVAKMIDIPVFHVNADDPEAVLFIAQLAAEYRMTFRKSVVINLMGYRRLGHNEADEPAATQPMMYRLIKAHETSRTLYANKLIEKKIVTKQQVEGLQNTYIEKLDKGKPVVDILPEGLVNHYASNWSPYLISKDGIQVNTGVKKSKIKQLGHILEAVGETFTMQRQVAQVMKNRMRMTAEDMPVDWGYAETMAYATLLDEGYSVRISGQDVQRGTFAHRHAVLHDYENGEELTPLKRLDHDLADFQIYNSLLSEFGVLGFEYGYSATDPRSLVIWEAQFGDFANGAQVVIDQFISSGWQKWKRLSGLVMLLPHGYEGMGPEHTSARLERFLQLSAQHNMQVCVPSTPSQIFHLLRRQMIRPVRIPLIVMSPKSLLRHKEAVSSLDELANGEFQLVIPEIEKHKANNIKRIVLCSGKVYYELVAKRRENKDKSVVIIRIEQLYPFPHEELKKELKRYKNAKQVVWCQEESKNQGAWFCSRHNFQDSLAPWQELIYAGREDSAAPAAGYMRLHARLQKALVEEAIG